MTKVNSVVGFLSGVVTYDNNETGNFHCQIDSNMNSFIVWSVDEDQSLMVTGDMYNPSWYAPLANLIAGLELSSDGFAWGSTPVTRRVVSDIVIHVNWNIALDNGTAIPLSATYERGVMTNHTPVVPLLDSPSNLEDVLSLLTVMIDNAVEACSFHPVPT